MLGGKGGVAHRLQPVLALQVGVDHVVLKWSRPDDRHLDHEVTEPLRPQPRQHVHLRAALDLEHAEVAGPAQHGIGSRAVARQAGQVMGGAMVPAQQRKAPPQAGQHAKPQHIGLEAAKGVDVVLVPLEDGAALHGGMGHDRRLDQRAAGDDEAADMGGGMPRQVEDLLGQLQRHGQAGGGGIEPLDLRQAHEAHRMPRPPAALGEAAVKSSLSPIARPTLRTALRVR